MGTTYALRRVVGGLVLVVPTSTSSERTGRSLILTPKRSPADWYPLFPNPVVAESLLDRMINTSHQVLMTGPGYHPRKRPGRIPLATKNDTG